MFDRSKTFPKLRGSIIGVSASGMMKRALVLGTLVIAAAACGQYVGTGLEFPGTSRFYAESHELDKRFVTNRPFTLAYTQPANPSNVSWIIPCSCSIAETISSASIKVSCSTSGSLHFQVHQDGDTNTVHNFYINLEHSSNCYAWNLADNSNISATLRTIHVWIQPVDEDPTSATVSQVFLQVSDHIVYQTAQDVTRTFYRSGDQPNFLFLHEPASILDTNFDDSGGYWVISVESESPGEFPVTVTGKGMLIVGCLVMDTPRSITFPKFGDSILSSSKSAVPSSVFSVVS